MCDYKEMLISLIGGIIEERYGVEVVEILSDVIFNEDKEDPDYVDFSMTVLMKDEKDYSTRAYRVKGFFSYVTSNIVIVGRKFLADC